MTLGDVYKVLKENKDKWFDRHDLADVLAINTHSTSKHILNLSKHAYFYKVEIIPRNMSTNEPTKIKYVG